MKRYLLLTLSAIAMTNMMADTKTISSPDGKLTVNLNTDGGKLTYSITYEGKQVLQPSALGFKADMGDYSQDLNLLATRENKVDKSYTITRTKASNIHYEANSIEMDFNCKDSKRVMTFVMNVSNNNVAYKYKMAGSNDSGKDEPRRMTIKKEESSFKFPEQSTTFICPQIDGVHKGWMSTKPSYEEEYQADAPMNVKSQYNMGYTFPCLFHVKNSTTPPQGGKGQNVDSELWALVSETGVTSNYCGSHLSDYNAETGYTVAFPNESENHGLGSATPAICLPGETPWRTITIGSTLKPIVETTIPFDVVDPLYAPSRDYKHGRYTWSWLIWQDNSINYDDQVKFIDLASAMGFEYCLVDNWWDTQIGRDKIEQLSKYAQSKGVSLMLWYNSNGYINDAPQGPRNCMNSAIAREKEMAWLEKIGVKGIKVDFFGGDKQQTMLQYEDILSDANRHGIQVVFHGCTIPRGWERMYPNYVSSEAVLASENVFFTDYHAKKEGFELCMHPYCRNAVGSMDWGGTIMNRYFSKDNKSRHQRYTTDVFEMASGIVNQASVQCVAMQPNNLEELPQFELDFLKALPTTWDETQYIDGYPTQSIIMARRAGDKWYVVGLNGTDQPIVKTLNLPQFAGMEVNLYADNKKKDGETVASSYIKKVKVDKKGNLKVTLQPMGGIIIAPL